MSGATESQSVGADESSVAADNRAGFPWTPDALVALRQAPARRKVALVVLALVGLGLAWVHWLGLFVAGALVGLVSMSLSRAVLAGVAIGVVVLLVHVLASPAMGVGEFVGLQPLSLLSIVVAIVAPVWGALVRAVV